ncbi:phosphomannose isomerase type II C-terminal cupin domain [Ornithinimicrobium sp. W1665]|uniref:phosphomannose isomerase type II C-terminal cupin domain n=1 Tax=Ornithinimicrobium sp. W1665 TaxID=3416666 RepID=UPI003CEAEC86
MQEGPVMGDLTEDVFAVERPWGQFRQFVGNETVTVKIITVEPGHRLSLQRHRRRSELWHVVDGPVEVWVDGDRWTAETGQDVWVPRGSTHRLGNPGRMPARVLEVAFGDFDEADIERLEDDYTRD